MSLNKDRYKYVHNMQFSTALIGCRNSKWVLFHLSSIFFFFYFLHIIRFDVLLHFDTLMTCIWITNKYGNVERNKKNKIKWNGIVEKKTYTRYIYTIFDIPFTIEQSNVFFMLFSFKFTSWISTIWNWIHERKQESKNTHEKKERKNMLDFILIPISFN